MKTGDRVKINIRLEKKNNFCKWLYDGVQHTMGTIEREYNKDIHSVDEYEFLVVFDNPPLQSFDGNRPFKACWFNHKDLMEA